MDQRRHRRGGFTMVEVALVATILGVMGMIAYPQVNRRVQQGQSENAARVVASDLRTAVSLAMLQGTPIKVDFNTSTLTLQIKDRATNAVISTRKLGHGTEFPITSATTSSSSIVVFPYRSTSAQLDINLVTSQRTMRVRITVAGLVTVVQVS